MILPVVDDNVVACLGEMLRRRGPDASPRSRDDRDRPAHLNHKQIIAYRVVDSCDKGRRFPGAPWTGQFLVWSPSTSLPVLLSVIDGAKRELDVENEEMGDASVISALAAAARRA
jgi:hypothetical protein